MFIKGKGKYVGVVRMDAYIGVITYVDLTLSRITVRPYIEEMKRKYLGGRGLGTRMVADSLTPDTDPLGPNNVLVLASGPLLHEYFRFRGWNVEGHPTSQKLAELSL